MIIIIIGLTLKIDSDLFANGCFPNKLLNTEIEKKKKIIGNKHITNLNQTLFPYLFKTK